MWHIRDMCSFHPALDFFSSNNTNYTELYKKLTSHSILAVDMQKIYSHVIVRAFIVRESFSSCADLLTRWSCMKRFSGEAEGKKQTISPREDEDGVRNK